jgi:tyrosyl-tRNA synthetase
VTGSDLLDDLDARGLVHDTTDRAALAARLAEGPITLYHGIDPTADSLHIGNLIGLLMLRRFQDAGHRPIALAGGATGMVGDPSGRSDERNLLDDETLEANVAAIKAQISRFLDFDGGALQVDNRDWTEGVTLLEFLRDVGKHVTVNTMLARESVKVRIEGTEGISFTEFSYMLLQAWDYLWLSDSEGCELQIGGSDQWGNILGGVDLIRRKRGKDVHALSWPLITAPDGIKLGKSTGGRVWLDAGRTSPYQFFQHFMQTDDRQVTEFLGKFTLLPMDEVQAAAAQHAEAPERRLGQRRLALEVTTLVHGAEQAAAAAEATQVLFGGSDGVPSPEALALLVDEVPTSHRPVGEGTDLVELLTATELASSRSDARRGLKEGSIWVGDRRIEAGDDADPVIGPSDLVGGRYLLLRRGKKRYHLIVSE